VSSEVDEALMNALNVEVKDRMGEGVFVKNTIILTLVETPRRDGDKPDAQRFQMLVKTLQPIRTETAARMINEAAVQFQRQRMEAEKK
jgi:hypothetical protein